MPAAAVGGKRYPELLGVGGFKSDVKATAQPWRVIGNCKLEVEEWNSMWRNAQNRRNTSGEATFWSVTDADVRKRGDQTGLDTLVVHAVNDEC